MSNDILSCKKDYVTIIQGEDRTIALYVQKEDGKPFDLGAPTEIIVKFKKTDNTTLEKKLTDTDVVIVSAPRGELTVLLSDADTALLKIVDRADIEAEIRNGAGPDFEIRKVIFEKALVVVKSQF